MNKGQTRGMHSLWKSWTNGPVMCPLQGSRCGLSPVRQSRDELRVYTRLLAVQPVVRPLMGHRQTQPRAGGRQKQVISSNLWSCVHHNLLTFNTNKCSSLNNKISCLSLSYKTTHERFQIWYPNQQQDDITLQCLPKRTKMIHVTVFGHMKEECS